MWRAADLASGARLVLAAVMPWAMAGGGRLPAVLWVLAAASDWADGPLARRAGAPSRHGAILDNVADVAFVGGGLAAAAALGIVPWVVPGAVVLSVVDYARASWEASRGMAAPALARSRIGHAAGVMNYACLGIVVAPMAWPALVPPALVPAAALATVAVNMAAVLVRALGRRGQGRRRGPARGQPASSRAARRRKNTP